MIGVEHGVSPYPTNITELAQSAYRRDSVLRGLHQRQWEIKASTGSSSPALRGIEEEVRDLKSADLFEILRIRKAQRESGSDGSPFVEVTLLRFPGEEFSDVSQTRLFFTFPNSEPHIPKLISGLDLLARAAGSRDARDILAIVGDPDSIEDEDESHFFRKTHEESRVAKRRIDLAEEKGDMDEIDRMQEVRDMLATRLLEGRARGVPIKCILYINSYDETDELMINTMLDPKSWINVPASTQLINLVLEGGIWDKVEVGDPRLLDALLDEF